MKDYLAEYTLVVPDFACVPITLLAAWFGHGYPKRVAVKNLKMRSGRPACTLVPPLTDVALCFRRVS